MTQRAEPLLVLVVVLVCLTVIGGVMYIRTMYKGAYHQESLVEAANYAVQTVTTVGYGNWVPHWMDPNDERVLRMKAFSVPFMLSGAAVFAVIVGMAANLLSRL